MRKAINHLKKADPVMAAIISKAGPYRMQYRECDSRRWCGPSYISNLAERPLSPSSTGWRRRECEPYDTGGDPETAAAKVRALGLSRQKCLYRELARLLATAISRFERLPEMEDPDY
jgi:hypothetical protein